MASEIKTLIGASVQRVSDLIGEIHGAATGQASGIDRRTQQNAVLVEQSPAAAESLRDQAGQLQQVVQPFQLEDKGPRLLRARLLSKK